jgi:hypothetical protein
MSAEEAETFRIEMQRLGNERDEKRFQLELKKAIQAGEESRIRLELDKKVAELAQKKFELDERRMKREESFLCRWGSVASGVVVALVGLSGVWLSVSQNTATQKTIANLTISEQSKLEAEKQRYTRRMEMDSYAEKYKLELHSVDPKIAAARTERMVMLFGSGEVSEYMQRYMLAHKDNPVVVKEAVARLDQIITLTNTIIEGSCTVSDFLAHKWDLTETFAYLPEPLFDDPEIGKFFLSANEVPKSKGLAARLKKDGKYLSVKVNSNLHRQLKSSPWVIVRKKGDPQTQIRIPVLDRLPPSNQTSIEISKALSEKIGAKDGDVLEILQEKPFTVDTLWNGI